MKLGEEVDKESSLVGAAETSLGYPETHKADISLTFTSHITDCGIPSHRDARPVPIYPRPQR
jgi:hypothetical protein